MLIRVTTVEVCDARDDDSSNPVGKKNLTMKTKTLGLVHTCLLYTSFSFIKRKEKCNCTYRR